MKTPEPCIKILQSTWRCSWEYWAKSHHCILCPRWREGKEHEENTNRSIMREEKWKKEDLRDNESTRNAMNVTFEITSKR